MKGKKHEHVKLTAVSPAVEGVRQRQNRFSPRFKNVQDRARLELGDLLAHMFDQADDALFEMADRAGSDHDQNIYFEAMRELRIRRRGMEMEFGQRYDEVFRALGTDKAHGDRDEIDVASLALVQDNEIEEALALEGMVARAMSACVDELSLLTMRFDSLLDSVRITNDNNPIAPKALCESFASTCSGLDVDIKARLVVLKLYEKLVVSEFTGLYRTLNRDLAEQGVLASVTLADTSRQRRLSGHEIGRARRSGAPAYNRRDDYGEGYAAVGEEPGSNEDAMFYQLQGLLQRAGQLVGGNSQGPGGVRSSAGGQQNSARPAKAVHRAQLVDLLSSLQSFLPEAQIDDFGYIAETSRPRELRELIVDTLNKNLQQGDARFGLGGVDEDAVRLVSLLFQFVLEDDSLAAPLKTLLSLLQVPMAKVALIDKSFFGKNSHPARKLLNTMAHAGIGWSPAGNAERDFLYRKFKQAIETVLNSFDDDIDVFETVLLDFLSFLENERRRSSVVEQRTLETEQGKARAELAQARVVATIATSIGENKLPAVARELLEQAWSKVLFLIFAREGEDSGSWKSACRVMDELIWSVQPKTVEVQRERLLKLKPGLFNNLRAGLAKVGTSHFAMDNFFSQLSAIYENLLQTDAAVSTNPELDAQKRPAPPATATTAPPTDSGGTLDDLLSKSRVHSSGVIPPTRDALAASGQVGTAANDMAAEKVTQGPDATADEDSAEAVDLAMLSTLDKLYIGSWVQFRQSEAAAFRCRLAAVLKPSGKFIFVNRAGKKVAEWTREQLAKNVAVGIVMLLDDRQLFDRALESVISQLQQSKH